MQYCVSCTTAWFPIARKKPPTKNQKKKKRSKKQPRSTAFVQQNYLYPERYRFSPLENYPVM